MLKLTPATSTALESAIAKMPSAGGGGAGIEPEVWVPEVNIVLWMFNEDIL